MSKPTVYALIPARAGSKGLPGKNIRPLMGHPLLAWSIAAAKLTPGIDRVIVSTDSAEYANVAKKYGAEAPFLRPSVISGDRAKDIGFVMHALLWLAEHEDSIPEYIVHLRPTTPLRDTATMQKALEKIWADPSATSLCSVHELPLPPCKTFSMTDDGCLVGLIGERYIGMPRQDCPKGYQQNGLIDVLRSRHVLENGDLYGKRRLAFITNLYKEIDSNSDFEVIKKYQVYHCMNVCEHMDKIIKLSNKK